jgi:serine/threonine-protein kinase
MTEKEAKTNEVATPGPKANGAPELAPGMHIAGRYRLVRPLGSGAMGEVWAVFDQEVGEHVALKLLTAEPEALAERFRREVRLARRVTHRSVARTFDLGTDDGRRYLTMELVEGRSLKERLEEVERLSVAEALPIAVQVAEGLAAAHDVEVYHRDLKPANVLLAPDGRVVLTDFGLARSTASEEVDVTLVGSSVLGTPAYMAPEQLTGGTIGPHTDLYAFGALLFEMLTGRHVFVRANAVATALARLHEEPDDPRSLAAMPDRLAELVLYCLRREPDQRPESARVLAGELRALAQVTDQEDATATLMDSGERTGSGKTFLPIPRHGRTLAVLPFRYRGKADQSYLAESIAEELIDVLTMTRGLRVAALGATAPYRDRASDPREVGRALGVDAIVEGVLQVAGEQLRINARLIEVDTGLQLWASRFEGAMADVFELQESMARRIAEALRVELEVFHSRSGAPAEAVELYLHGRRRMAEADLSGASLDAAIALLDRCLQLAPGFAPAIATRAEAWVRRWFLPATPNLDVSEAAHSAVAEALERAPHLAQTHFAAARLAVSDGRFDAAARALATTLTIAPTYAEAHDYLGSLQCEAGRSVEGKRHIEHARELDPSLSNGVFALARVAAMDGDHETCHRYIEKLRARAETSPFALELLELRVACWHDDRETLRRLRPAAHFPDGNPMGGLAETIRRIVLGELATEELEGALELAGAMRLGPRLQSFVHQMAAEALGARGDAGRAFEQIRSANASGVLVDADWLERCPALASLRGHAGMSAIRDEVRRRVNAIWQTR